MTNMIMISGFGFSRDIVDLIVVATNDRRQSLPIRLYLNTGESDVFHKLNSLDKHNVTRANWKWLCNHWRSIEITPGNTLPRNVISLIYLFRLKIYVSLSAIENCIHNIVLKQLDKKILESNSTTLIGHNSDKAKYKPKRITAELEF